MIDSGLFSYWYQEAKMDLRRTALLKIKHKIEPPKTSRKLNLSQLKGVFWMWSLLLLTSFLICLVEKLLTPKAKTVLRNIQPSRKEVNQTYFYF
jgi:hypothetical protein